MARHLLVRNPRARKILRRVEKSWGKKLRISRGVESFYDPDTGDISVAPVSVFALMVGDHWPNCIAFHELAHAVIDQFWDKFDQDAFKKIFHGSPRFRYHEDIMPRVFTDVQRVMDRPSVTWYGKTHPEEAWAEAFSFALAEVDDREEDGQVIAQLAYCDWVIDHLVKGRARWGKFRQPEVDLDCPVCERSFALPCRVPTETKGWEGHCPYCEEQFEVVA